MVEGKKIKAAGIIVGGKKKRLGSVISENDRKKLSTMLEDLQNKLDKIEKQRVVAEKSRPKEISPEEARDMIERIEVPSLESIKSKRK